MLNGICFSAIEDSYDGPVLEDGEVTEKFMLELMEWYKAEKKLHKKYAYKVSSYVCKFFFSLPQMLNFL